MKARRGLSQIAPGDTFGGVGPDREGVLRLAQQGAEAATPEDLLRDPFVMEFTGIRPQDVFLESDLETALMDRLQEFLTMRRIAPMTDADGEGALATLSVGPAELADHPVSALYEHTRGLPEQGSTQFRVPYRRFFLVNHNRRL